MAVNLHFHHVKLDVKLLSLVFWLLFLDMTFKCITLFSKEVGLDLLTVTSVTHVTAVTGDKISEFCVLFKISDFLMRDNLVQGKVKLS